MNTTTTTIVLNNIPKEMLDKFWAKVVPEAVKQFDVQLEKQETITLDFDVIAIEFPKVFTEIISFAITGAAIMKVKQREDNAVPKTNAEG